MYDLTGKTVLITGASRGIGAACSRTIANAGATVIAHYGSYVDGAREALEDIPIERKFFISADLSVPGSGRQLVSDALQSCSRIDAVINNAAVNLDTPFTGDDETWDENWMLTMRINVLESANVVREAVRHFLEFDGGILISMSSWSGQRGSAIAQLSAYAASKAAVKALTQTVALNYAKDGILAYTIAPGIVKTRMAEAAAAARGGEESMKAALILGELVEPTDIANLVVFLVTGKCRHLTGSTIDVNGATYVR